MELNAGLVAILGELGVRAGHIIAAPPPEDVAFIQTVPEASDFPIIAELMTMEHEGRPLDLGRVGTPTAVAIPHLVRTLKFGKLPVLPSLGVDSNKRWLNVNADTAASAVAGALKADACYFLTDTPGVLRDIRDPASLFPRLTRAECQTLIADEVIAGGMIPTVEACFEALDAGAGRAVILDGRNPHALLGEFIGEPAGTEILP